ncbi:MAG: glutathione S-transferase family protein [Mariprofundaceae bacterium]
MSSIELYSAGVCPFAQRTRMVLLEKGLDFNLSEIDLANKPDWFASVSPYGKVPVLMHGDARVFESAIINEYLEESFPEPALMPGAPALRAAARLWIDFCNTRFIPPFYKLLLEQDKKTQSELKVKLSDELMFAEREGFAALAGGGPYWLGEQCSLVDITWYPFFERFGVIQHYRGMDIPADCKRLKQWFAAMQQRDSAKATGHATNYYIERYAKYAHGTADGVTAREMRDV